MRKFIRLVMVNALSVLAGWFSLYYGWGMEPKTVKVLAAYMAYIALVLPFLQSWIHRTEAGK
jgi:hypothetical protein